jgi:mono/diheme cytochrome c family protein
MKNNWSLLGLLTASALFLSALPAIAADETPAPKALFEKRCSRCHGLDKVPATGTPDFWKGTVKKMKEKWFSGITDQEMEIITQYLIQNRGAK